MITQKNSDEHALTATAFDGCALLTSATPRTSPVNSKGSSRAAETAVRSVEGVALDLLAQTNVAVGCDLPITSMVRLAGWLVEQAGSADGRTAYAQQRGEPLRIAGTSFLQSGSCGRIRQACEVERQLERHV